MSRANENFSSLSGARVAEERKRLSLSQAEAGSACGVSREMWGKYERGVATMGAEVLAAFVGCGADALYILTGGGTTSDERDLLNLFRAAPLAVKAAAVGALQSGAAPQGTKKRSTKITAHSGNAAGRDIFINANRRQNG
jgi:transcriptional regulator with XRE-family HTH domain